MARETMEKGAILLLVMLVWALTIALWPIILAIAIPVGFFDFHHEVMRGLQEEDVNSMTSFVRDSLLISSLPATVSFLILAGICVFRIFRRSECKSVGFKKTDG
jgi:hypothetical protein